MKQSRYSEPQILSILRQAQGGVPVAKLCSEHGMSDAPFYKWRTKYGGMDASMVSSMKAMEDENRRLEQMFAELSMQNQLLKQRHWQKTSPAISTLRNGRILIVQINLVARACNHLYRTTLFVRGRSR